MASKAQHTGGCYHLPNAAAPSKSGQPWVAALPSKAPYALQVGGVVAANGNVWATYPLVMPLAQGSNGPAAVVGSQHAPTVAALGNMPVLHTNAGACRQVGQRGALGMPNVQAAMSALYGPHAAVALAYLQLGAQGVAAHVAGSTAYVLACQGHVGQYGVVPADVATAAQQAACFAFAAALVAAGAVAPFAAPVVPAKGTQAGKGNK